MNKLKIKCTLTDRTTGKTVDLEDMTEEERLRAAEKIALRALEVLYGPEYVVNIEKS